MKLKFIQYILTIIVIIEVLETYSFESPSDCGKSSLIGKSMTQFIVGGTDAKPKEFPFMASLQRNVNSVWRHFCGGTVLNNRWVLTAAHCLMNKNVTQIELLIGSIKLDDSDPFKRYYLDKWIKNGCFGKRRLDPLDGDIALLKTSTDIEIDGINVSAICLPPKNKGLISNEVILSGWGVWSETTSSEPEESPKILQKLFTKVYSEEFCQMYTYLINDGLFGFPLRNRLCIFDYKSTDCRGDSGGPLMQIIDGKVYQFGITSFGPPNVIPLLGNNRCFKSSPGFYWNVSEPIDWISNTIDKYVDSSEAVITTDCED